VPIAKPWIETPIDLAKVSQRAKNIVVFLSDDDCYGCQAENKKRFESGLGAKVIVERQKGHFTKEEGIVKVPEVLKVLEGWM
jgi:predicted alpha/beta hydrolase family esterase